MKICTDTKGHRRINPDDFGDPWPFIWRLSAIFRLKIQLVQIKVWQLEKHMRDVGTALLDSPWKILFVYVLLIVIQENNQKTVFAGKLNYIVLQII